MAYQVTRYFNYPAGTVPYNFNENHKGNEDLIEVNKQRRKMISMQKEKTVNEDGSYTITFIQVWPSKEEHEKMDRLFSVFQQQRDAYHRAHGITHSFETEEI